MAKQYKVGDTVWYLNFPLITKCQITKVNHILMGHPPKDMLFYDIDEPVDCSLHEAELYENYLEAMTEAAETLNFLNELKISPQEQEDYKNTTLQSLRKINISLILSFGDKSKTELIEKIFSDNPFKDKVRGIDWFNVFDLKYNKGLNL